jgi:hypothetical protein
MPLRWILEGIAEFALESILEIGTDILGDKLLARKHNLSTYGKNRKVRSSLRRKLTGYALDEVDEPAAIYEKPKTVSDSRPDSIRQAGIIKLKAMLGKDGKIKYIQPIKSSGNRQTRLAIAEIKKIRFHPARKNGYPVDQWIEVDYQIGE